MGRADFVLFEVCGFSVGIDAQAAEFLKTGTSALQGRNFLLFGRVIPSGARNLALRTGQQKGKARFLVASLLGMTHLG